MSSTTSPSEEQSAAASVQKALASHRTGAFDEAEAHYQSALQRHPANAAAHYGLGLLALRVGQWQATLAHLGAAVENQPQNARHWLAYIAALQLCGETHAVQELIALARQHALDPNTADLLALWLGLPLRLQKELPRSLRDSLSLPADPVATRAPRDAVDEVLAHFGAGAVVQAEEQARRMTTDHPTDAFGWKALGAALWQQGRLEDALDPMLRAVELAPDDVDAINNLGAAVDDYGLTAHAERLYRRALAIAPEHVETLNNLGDHLCQRNRFEEARQVLEHALTIRPGYAKAHNNLGCVLCAIGETDRALDHLHRALEIEPDYPQALINLANALQDKNRLTAAERALRRALGLRPDDAMALNNLGNVLTLIGRTEEAESALRRALALKPDYFDAYSNLLFTLNYGDHGTPQQRLDDARRYGERVAQRAKAYTSWRVEERPAKLRIGLVSGDLRNHPVGFFLAAVLPQLSRLDVELFAYPTQARKDRLTDSLRQACRAWHPLFGLADADAAQHIHDDAIHVLIDLAGHTAGNRLPVFAYKPAPVQVSWLGYFATTGVAQIDYLLADRTGVPEDERDQFTEEVRYLPDTRLCFSFPDVDIEINELPAIRNGHVTFGSFQNLAKANDRVLAVWARIMAALPDSTLRWQCKQFGDAEIVDATLVRFERLGIAHERVALRAPTTRDAYFAAHHEIDMILDTFPYPGGTTTCEALWMGVPTLTLAGNSMHSRQGASLMTAAGLRDWIATGPVDFIDRALMHARRLDELSALRSQLRDRIESSPLFDAALFALRLSGQLQDMWAASCRAVVRR